MKILGELSFRVKWHNGKYFVVGGQTMNNGFGWANYEKPFNSKDEAINAICETIQKMYIKDIPN